MTTTDSVSFMLCNSRKPEMVVMKNPDGTEHRLNPQKAVIIACRLLITPVPKRMCLRPRKTGLLTASLSYKGYVGINRGTSLEIRTDFQDLRNFNFRTNCMSEKQNNCRWDAQHCLANLMAGKCKDPFIRETVGEILFPEHYAPQKQR